MTREEQISLHSERAMTELDLALCAATIKAAKAHFGLSSLHLDKLRALADAAVSVPRVQA